MLTKEDHMKICGVFNEVLNDLEKEIKRANFEYGGSGLKRGLREDERQRIHGYRVKLNEALKQIQPWLAQPY